MQDTIIVIFGMQLCEVVNCFIEKQSSSRFRWNLFVWLMFYVVTCENGTSIYFPMRVLAKNYLSCYPMCVTDVCLWMRCYIFRLCMWMEACNLNEGFVYYMLCSFHEICVEEFPLCAVVLCSNVLLVHMNMFQ
jgi:hypothetical protein